MYVTGILLIKYKYNQLVQSQYTKIHYFKQDKVFLLIKKPLSVYSHIYVTHIFCAFFLPENYVYCITNKYSQLNLIFLFNHLFHFEASIYTVIRHTLFLITENVILPPNTENLKLIE